MSYSAPQIECMRFTGRVGGIGIGCCAIDEFQGFNTDPDAPATVELLRGDDLPNKCSTSRWLGKTNKEVFLGYLRYGTFDVAEMPDRIFLASLTDQQIGQKFSQEWLRIMKEQGFGFVCSVNNSVYTRSVVPDKPGGSNPHRVHLFMLVRNISSNACLDERTPPKFWTDLPEREKTLTELWRDNPVRHMSKEEATGEKSARKVADLSSAAAALIPG